MRPVLKTARIRYQLVRGISVKRDSVPPGIAPFVEVTTERSGSSLSMELLASRWAMIRSDDESPIRMCNEGDRSKVFRRRRILPIGVIVVSSVDFVASEESPANENRQKLAYENLEDFLTGLPIMKTAHETLMEDMDLETHRFGEFLGVGESDQLASLRHRNPESHSLLISDFEQSRRDLAELGRAGLVGQVEV
jgi:hypothetical protein